MHTQSLANNFSETRDVGETNFHLLPRSKRVRHRKKARRLNGDWSRVLPVIGTLTSWRFSRH